MNYSNDSKPAQIFNLRSLEELNESFYLQRDNDTAYFSIKKPENNINRVVFNLQTSDINVTPTIRLVNCVNKNKKYPLYQSFAIETKDKSTGIAIIMIKLDDQKTFYCNMRILPLNTLNDVADKEADSPLLTVNLEKANYLLKTDITINPSNTGEALYSTHEVDVNAISDLITSAEMIELKRELEFQGAKLIAHYCQEIIDIVINENSTSNNTIPMLSEDYVLQLPLNSLKELLSANVISGNIALEIVGSNVIRNLNKDWIGASSFIDYLL
ncbi:MULTISPECIES: hypothetical protein [unclassified Chryseobacterium]|uniref:hypothetical protein n=1 Tax=unclassified Chryseobacterium TaxID=2593645 RepID=UPI00100ACF49|nr:MULTISPECIES: hypothetical protein [unclassified Chryseobacterium]RXM51672.1 hypothetical protein BOQ64_12180 [Chryseobacterium sp. CH25]RXM67249.1 hypothetical protein BOQ60_04905 [Chryseobacterium sp. CH1]